MTMNDRCDYYVIEVESDLDNQWSVWLDGLEVIPHPDRGRTTLQGALPDQAALRGLLNRLWDLNLSVVGVRQVRVDD